MPLFLTLLNNLRATLFHFVNVSLSIFLSSCFPSCLLAFPGPLTLLLLARTPLPSYRLIYRCPTSATSMFSMLPSIVARKVALLLPQVKPFSHALNPLLTPSQGPTPSAFAMLRYHLLEKTKHLSLSLPLSSTPFLPTSLFLNSLFTTDFLDRFVSSSSLFIHFPTQSNLFPTPGTSLKLLLVRCLPGSQIQ